MNTIRLEILDVKEPCTADWDEMQGTDSVRFCKHCQFSVYNLSAMTREAGERLVADREGRLCIRMYRRADGTVMTADCENAWKRVVRAATVMTGTMARFVGAAVALLFAIPATGVVAELLAEKNAARANPGARVLMGDMVCPPKPATQPVSALMGGCTAGPMSAIMAKVAATRPATVPSEEK